MRDYGLRAVLQAADAEMGRDDRDVGAVVRNLRAALETTEALIESHDRETRALGAALSDGAADDGSRSVAGRGRARSVAPSAVAEHVTPEEE